MMSFPFFPTLDGFHRQARRVADGKGRDIAKGGLQEWQDFLDEDPIAWSVLYPTAGLTFGLVRDQDWACALATGYNNYLYETFTKPEKRLKGIERGVRQIADLLRDDILFCATDFPHEPRSDFRGNIARFMAREDILSETKQKICFENPKRMYPLAFQ